MIKICQRITATKEAQICSHKLAYSCPHRYASTKSEVSTTFLLRENWRHGKNGQTDGQPVGVQCLMRPHKEGRIISTVNLAS